MADTPHLAAPSPHPSRSSSVREMRVTIGSTSGTRYFESWEAVRSKYLESSIRSSISAWSRGLSYWVSKPPSR